MIFLVLHRRALVVYRVYRARTYPLRGISPPRFLLCAVWLALYHLPLFAELRQYLCISVYQYISISVYQCISVSVDLGLI